MDNFIKKIQQFKIKAINVQSLNYWFICRLLTLITLVGCLTLLTSSYLLLVGSTIQRSSDSSSGSLYSIQGGVLEREDISSGGDKLIADLSLRSKRVGDDLYNRTRGCPGLERPLASEIVVKNEYWQYSASRWVFEERGLGPDGGYSELEVNYNYSL